MIDFANSWVASTIISLLRLIMPFSMAIATLLDISRLSRSTSCRRCLRNLESNEGSITSSSGLSPRKNLYDMSVYARFTKSSSEAGCMAFNIRYLNMRTGSSAERPMPTEYLSCRKRNLSLHSCDGICGHAEWVCHRCAHIRSIGFADNLLA